MVGQEKNCQIFLQDLFKMKNISIILIACLLLAGCDKINTKEIEPKKYVALVSVCSGMATLQADRPSPSPMPRPTPSPNVPLPKDCDICGGKGWLGDGRPRSDCPNCDASRPPDGNADEDLSIHTVRFQEEIRQEKIRQEVEKAKMLQSQQKQWFETSIEDVIQSDNKLPIVVVISNELPSIFEDNVVKEFMGKNYKLVLLPNNQITVDLWAPKGKNNRFVRLEDDMWSIDDPVYCVLDSEGRFVEGTTNSNVFRAIPEEQLELIESIEYGAQK